MRNAEQIIQECAAKTTTDRPELLSGAAALEIMLLRAELRAMAASLQPGQPPLGILQAEMQLDGTKVWIEYEYDPGEEPHVDVESRACSPGCGPSCRIGAVFVNGYWIEAFGHIQAEILERWTQELIETHLRNDL